MKVMGLNPGYLSKSFLLYKVMHDFLLFIGEDIQSAGAAVPVMDLSKASIALEDQDIVIG